jgi:transposase
MAMTVWGKLLSDRTLLDLRLPKWWIIEQTLAWIGRNRRLARDFDRYATTVAAYIRPAHDPHHAQATCGNASP